jgi:hypothetical protein
MVDILRQRKASWVHDMEQLQRCENSIWSGSVSVTVLAAALHAIQNAVGVIFSAVLTMH